MSASALTVPAIAAPEFVLPAAAALVAGFWLVGPDTVVRNPAVLSAGATFVDDVAFDDVVLGPVVLGPVVVGAIGAVALRTKPPVPGGAGNGGAGIETAGPVIDGFTAAGPWPTGP